MKKYIQGLSLVVLFALGQAAMKKQPNESKVTLIDGSWNPGEGGSVTTQPHPLNRPFGVDFDFNRPSTWPRFTRWRPPEWPPPR